MFKERKPDQYVQMTALRRIQRAQGAGERLWRQARGAARRAALRSGAQCQHARRRCARGPVPVRRPAAGRIVLAARGNAGVKRCRADRAVRLSVPGAEHQAGAAGESLAAAPGGAGGAQQCRHDGRRIRRPEVLHRRGQPLREEHAVLLGRPAPSTTARATPRRPSAGARQASYDGAPIKILTSQQYDFHYRMALVMAENLKGAGFKADMQVVDWATLIQRRNDPALWDIYITHSAVLPEPTLTPPQLGDGAPGWWSSPAKEAALAAFNAEADPNKRGALWGNVQQVVYNEVPYIKVGNFNSLTGALREARRLRRDAVAVLLEHGTAEVERHRRVRCHMEQRYLASRFAGMVIVMLLVATLVFFITRLAPAIRPRSCSAIRRPPPTSRSCSVRTGSTSRCRVQFALLAGRAGARQSRPVDLPAAAGHAGAAGARRADLSPRALFDRHRDADRRSLRHHRRGVARQRGRPVLLGLRDARREHPELLVRPDPDADLRGGARLVSGGGLWQSRRAAGRAAAPPGACRRSCSAWSTRR